MSSSVPIEKPAYIPHAIPQVQRDIEEVDAMDSQGYWYQAFIVKQDEKEALVHFSGWGKETAEKIQISDFPKRIRARSATAATGQGIKPSKEDVRKMFGLPASVQPAALPAAHASVQVQRDIEEVDAMDSQGYWYQAFIVKQDEKEALVHFSGWGKETAEKIQISDFPKRIRARSATAATGQGILPSKEDVRKMFGLPAYVPSASPAQLPVGWEVLYDPSGKVYYGNRALMKVQWEHPSEGVTSGKRHLANQYAALLPRQQLRNA
jgi:phage-related protein